MKVIFGIEVGDLELYEAARVIDAAIRALQDHAHEAAGDYGLPEADIVKVRLPIQIVGTEK